MIGMVMIESRCDTSAMPAAVEVSFPYALGITMVLSPKGMAREQMVQTNRTSEQFGKKERIPMATKGNINNRSTETA